MDNNQIIADVISKILSGGGSVALGFAMWFGWQVFKVVKEIHTSFEGLVKTVSEIKEQNDTQLLEVVKMRAALEGEGYAIRTAPFRRFKSGNRDD